MALRRPRERKYCTLLCMATDKAVISVLISYIPYNACQVVCATFCVARATPRGGTSAARAPRGAFGANGETCTAGAC